MIYYFMTFKYFDIQIFYSRLKFDATSKLAGFVRKPQLGWQGGRDMYGPCHAGDGADIEENSGISG
jgi:hypothetical protein